MENAQTPYQQDQKQSEYAGFWWRFLAYVIDSIIISLASWIFIIPFLAIFGISIFSLQESGYDMDNPALFLAPFMMAIIPMAIIGTVAQWLYFALMESGRHQGTVGKLLLKIKVTDTFGNRVSFAKATGRYFGKILSGMILLIGYIMAGFTARKQALHDILANCYVIKEN
jgi:uncharacterized RDD family membrane protein YckC